MPCYLLQIYDMTFALRRRLFKFGFSLSRRSAYYVEKDYNLLANLAKALRTCTVPTFRLLRPNIDVALTPKGVSKNL